MRGMGGGSHSRLATILVVGLLAAAFLVPAEAAGPFSVHGRVTDADGEPIAGALVKSIYNSDRFTTTDSQGRYQLDYPSPTYDYLEASAPGRFPAYEEVSTPWEFDAVDFFLSLDVVPRTTPARVKDAAGVTLEITGTTGPKSGVCMRTKIPATTNTVAMSMAAHDGFVTGTATYTYPSSLPDGTYFSSIVAHRCDDPRFTLGIRSYSFAVDSAPPAITSQYPAPGSTVPEDELIPSFRITDSSGFSKDDVSFYLTDLTAGETTALDTVFSFSSVQGSAVQVVEGHQYRLSVDSVDNIGNVGHVEWEFSVSEAVPTPTIVKTAPYDYGERCERFSAVLTVSSSCLSEPSALRDGRLTLAFTETKVTGTALATVGYRFMGAGVKYTFPKTGDIEATADFTYADGKGQLCILVFGAVEGSVVMSSCGGIDQLQQKFQFHGRTGQTYRIGGYLVPECAGDPATAQTCNGAATARLSKVTIEFRGTP